MHFYIQFVRATPIFQLGRISVIQQAIYFATCHPSALLTWRTSIDDFFTIAYDSLSKRIVKGHQLIIVNINIIHHHQTIIVVNHHSPVNHSNHQCTISNHQFTMNSPWPSTSINHQQHRPCSRSLQVLPCLAWAGVWSAFAPAPLWWPSSRCAASNIGRGWEIPWVMGTDVSHV